MNRDPASMTYWEWQALLWTWNDRHNPDKKSRPAENLPKIDPRRAAAAMAKVAARDAA
ncbi:MAG TPA: hypothetical protein VKB96_11005 [Gammaproteobacteria bacterium]|nr:hypothetical protein [Gammaproteobacteria bacterium]